MTSGRHARTSRTGSTSVGVSVRSLTSTWLSNCGRSCCKTLSRGAAMSVTILAMTFSLERHTYGPASYGQVLIDCRRHPGIVRYLRAGIFPQPLGTKVVFTVQHQMLRPPAKVAVR